MGVNHDGYEEWKDLGIVVEPTHRAKRSPTLLGKKLKTKKKLKVVTSPKWKPKAVFKKLAFNTACVICPQPGLGTVGGVGLVKKTVLPVIKSKKGIGKLGPKGLAGLTLVSAPV